MQTMQIRGSIDIIIVNSDNVYQGNLVHYFQTIFFKATNLNHPYHNFRHMLHVAYLCYDAAIYYTDVLNKRDIRNLLIAALFHDFNHRGTMDSDILNIMLAVQGLVDNILAEDEAYIDEITTLIKTTEYPYKNNTDLSLLEQIIRDADFCQALNSVWLQQVVLGLAAEWKVTPLESLKLQIKFLENLKFHTSWAQETWPKEKIYNKIEESHQLLEILEA